MCIGGGIRRRFLLIARSGMTTPLSTRRLDDMGSYFKMADCLHTRLHGKGGDLPFLIMSQTFHFSCELDDDDKGVKTMP